MKMIVENALRKVAENHGVSEEEVKREIEAVFRLRSEKSFEKDTYTAEEIVMCFVNMFTEREEP